MDARSLYPKSPGTSSSALASRTIRHRGLSPRIPQESSSRSPRLPLPAETREEADETHIRPRIIRGTSHAYGSSPVLPFSEQEAGPSQLHEIRESSSFSENVLDAVPLTPRPDLQTRSKSELSHISRLPSPDFSAPPPQESDSFSKVFDFFKTPSTISRPKSKRKESDGADTRSSGPGRYASGLLEASSTSIEFLRGLRMPSMDRLKSQMNFPLLNSSDANNRPQQHRTQSQSSSRSSGSSSSARSYASTASIDSGRTHLFPGIKTTDRFTHRWPRPSNLKKLERRDSLKTSRGYQPVSSQELGSGSFDVGLGFERCGRWTTHKWCLFLSMLSLLGYSIGALVYSILTWYQTWEHADVMLVTDGDVLILSTLCASLLLLAALVGLTGTLLNSRALLAIYALLLWPALVSLLSIGYVSYKRAAFSLDRKLNLAWSQWYTDAGRAIIQDGLRCCGFTDPTHEAFYGPGHAGGCYPRSLRPGCKGPLLRFSRENLESIWRAAFSVVPLHFVNIVVALLCANHVTRRFGTGVVPKGYRLRVQDVRADARCLLEYFVKEADGGAARVPPKVARTESGMGWRREDRASLRTGGF